MGWFKIFVARLLQTDRRLIGDTEAVFYKMDKV